MARRGLAAEIKDLKVHQIKWIVIPSRKFLKKKKKKHVMGQCGRRKPFVTRYINIV